MSSAKAGLTLNPVLKVSDLCRRSGKLLVREPLARWLAIIVTVLLAVLLVLPALTSTSPTAFNAGSPLSPPSAEHIFGTDQLGRDVAVRVLYGARTTLLIAAASAAFALICGALLGAVAASGPKLLDEIVMRIIDVGLAFPGILLAIVLAAVIGPSVPTTILVLGAVFTPPMARVVRAVVFSEFGEDYVTAARLLGTSRFRLVVLHIGINAALPVLVFTTLVAASGIIAEAGLSFLGAGIKPPAPSWGNIIADGQRVVQSGAWWVSLFPGLAIVLTVLGMNRFAELLGRRLRVR